MDGIGNPVGNTAERDNTVNATGADDFWQQKGGAVEIAGGENKVVTGIGAAAEKSSCQIRKEEMLQRLEICAPEKSNVFGAFHDEGAGILARDKACLLYTIQNQFSGSIGYTGAAVNCQRNGTGGNSGQFGNIFNGQA